MFEISDDDDEFWEDLPLVDINDRQSSETKKDFKTCKDKTEASLPPIKKTKLDKENSEQCNYTNQSQISSEQLKNPHCVLLNKKAKQPHLHETDTNFEESSNMVQSSNQSTCGFFTPIKDSCYMENSNMDTTQSNSSAEIREIGISSSRHQTASFNKQTPNSNLWLDQNKKPLSTKSEESESSGLNETPIRRVKRKFPGPAGRLPKLKPGEPIIKMTSTSPESDNKVSQNIIPCTQATDEGLNETSWQTLVDDLGPEADIILDQFSVSASLQMASKKLLPRGKIPLLFVMVESIDLLGAGGSVVLKDKTGKIKGTLHRDIIKEYGGDIQAGTTLVLRQVGVVSPTNRTHYLNITPTNMVYLNSNNLNINKHVFQHTSLKHFMTDFKKKIEEDVDPMDNSILNGTTSVPKTPQCFLPNKSRTLQSGTSVNERNLELRILSNRGEEILKSKNLNQGCVIPCQSQFGQMNYAPRSSNSSSVLRFATPKGKVNSNQIFPSTINNCQRFPNVNNLTPSCVKVGIQNHNTCNARLGTPNNSNVRLITSANTDVRHGTPIYSNVRLGTTNNSNVRLSVGTANNSNVRLSVGIANNSNVRLGAANNSNSRLGTANNCNVRLPGGIANNCNVRLGMQNNSNLRTFTPGNLSSQGRCSPMSGNMTTSSVSQHSTGRQHSTINQGIVTSADQITNVNNSLIGSCDNTHSVSNSTVARDKNMNSSGVGQSRQETSSCSIPVFGKKKPVFPAHISNQSLLQSVDHTVSTPKTPKFNFKSKTPNNSPSPNASIVSSLSCQTNSVLPGNDMWQDDITDELLSHFTDDIM